ncbi:hypothetical protein DMO24_16955 [Modestobacter versicolor]|uniref:Uncharacterized protein n=2 Tax=Modestobacter versicolor TaxID=429133 RepID=A0A323VJH7_9ACTN|nr:hypothetical protein DMO24_16955 [Modestobacter versicolor]
MSMSAPFDPVQPTQDDGIPAADAGTGAPPPAEGFGVGGEEPDRPEETGEGSGGAPDADPPFRTPDPTQVGPEPTGDPVDPAIATSTPDPGQTGRDQR